MLFKVVADWLPDSCRFPCSLQRRQHDKRSPYTKGEGYNAWNTIK